MHVKAYDWKEPARMMRSQEPDSFPGLLLSFMVLHDFYDSAT